MAQTQEITNLTMGEIGRLLAGEAATGIKSIVGLTGACTAAAGSTFANPGGATKLAANGFTLVDADTVTSETTAQTDDTVQLDHVFTASGAQSVTGFACENDDDDVVMGECCFADALAMILNDTLTCQMTWQIKKD